jgi:transglutaminase-like putative cysteine protease
MQVLSLTLLVIAACLPLARYLHWQVSAFLLLLFAVRFSGLTWRAALPGAWLRALLTFAGVANCLYANHTLVGQDGGAALFATMLALKLLELKTKRDLRLVAILIGFLIVIQFLFDQSFPLTLYLGVMAVGAVALLVDLNGGLGEGARLRATLRMTATLSLQALPLALVLFVLFPRLSAPLWSLGLDSQQSMTGMSDSMEPGAISELVLNGELAFRVRFAATPPSPNQLYWRGLVLWEMDGRRWSPGHVPADWTAPARLEKSASLIDYEIVLEPTGKTWLFALDLPIGAPEDDSINPDFQLLSRQPVNVAKRYRVRSALDYRTGEPDARLRELALRLPGNITPRMRALVSGWREHAASDWELVQQGLAFFNRESFHYTLLPPRLGANPADEFLFETRRGFCEHYASSFALLMRVGGIPARIVLGYLGGETNQIGGYQMVWQSDAHAWVEVLIAGRGWVRVDPTAAIDPARVDNRSATQLLGASHSVRFNLDQASALARVARNLRLLADTLDATWQNWVLDFSAEDQFALLDRLGLAEFREYGLAVLMVLAVSLTLGVILLALMRDPATLDPLDAQYARFCQRLARAGLPRQPTEGPSDFGRRVMARRPDLTSAVSRFLALYIPARFGPHPRGETIVQLARQLRGFHPRSQARR